MTSLALIAIGPAAWVAGYFGTMLFFAVKDRVDAALR